MDDMDKYPDDFSLRHFYCDRKGRTGSIKPKGCGIICERYPIGNINAFKDAFIDSLEGRKNDGHADIRS